MDFKLAFPAQLSQHLRSLRKSQGLTQAQLAERMGVMQSRISALEKDASKLTVEQLFRVLATLNAGIVLRTSEIEPRDTHTRTESAPAGGHPEGQW